MPRRPHLLANLAALTFLFTTGCVSRSGQDIPGVSNFGEVTPGLLYRGAQPTEEGIATLYARGVRTIVNLRDDFNPDEERWVKSHPDMRYVQIKSNAWRPNDPDVRRFLALMSERAVTRAPTPPVAPTPRLAMVTPAAPTTAPVTSTPRLAMVTPAAAAPPDAVFVHCAVGRDRTGLFVAAYRIANDGLDVDPALQEMDNFGHVRPFFPGLQPFIREHADGWRDVKQVPSGSLAAPV